MNQQRAELISLATTLDELIARITAAAESSQESKDESNAIGLFDVERALQNAARKLANVVSSLR